MTILTAVTRASAPVIRLLNWLQPAYMLGLRLYLANVFLKSGLTKIQTWDSTLALFTYEYKVPLLSPEVAAVMGTTTELTFPVLLALGLAGRFAAGVLFVFNIIAATSYPELNDAGLMQHEFWGLLLLMPLLYGPGKLSVDCLLKRWLKP